MLASLPLAKFAIAPIHALWYNGSTMKKLEDYVISVPDVPKKGIVWRDITGILGDADAFALSIDLLCAALDGVEFASVAALESRGFIFGAPVAARLGKKFIPIRKPGKLPRATISRQYTLEYGSGTIEMHRDAVAPGERVVIIDDLLATGGTAAAACSMIEELGGIVAKLLFAIELPDLAGRNLLGGRDVESLTFFSGD